MKRLLYSIACTLLLASCGGESTTTTTTTDSTAVDTTAAVIPNVDIDESGLLSKFTVSSVAPFVQDTTYLASIEPNDSMLLSADQVRFLSYNFVENDISYNGKTTIDDVFFFDSLKTNNEYEGYLEVIDIGMMKSANAYVDRKLTLDDSTTLLLWYVDFSTYEACPYFAGKTLYATIFRNNEAKSCTLIGEDSGGGDAPYWSETTAIFSLVSNKMTVHLTDRNGGDTDEEGNDLVSETKRSFSLEIVNGTWVITETTEGIEA